jgi:hypothetical protein
MKGALDESSVAIVVIAATWAGDGSMFEVGLKVDIAIVAASSSDNSGMLTGRLLFRGFFVG